MIRPVRVPSVADLTKAWDVVSAHLGPTPLSQWLKLESAQPIGSFKIRGALAAMSALPADVEVVTASAGNHGLGVALAAQLLHRRTTVVVPGNASSAKVAALRGYGVNLVEVGTSYDDAENHALAMDAYYLSPYNDPDVIAGQGTIGFELDAQVDGPMTVVCGIGGGGLAAGLGLWASQRPDVHIVGVEAAASTALSSSIKAGGYTTVTVGDTLADGMAGNIERGSVTVGLVSQHVGQLVTVTEPEIRSAIRYLATTHGLIAEGAGATPVAALLANKVKVQGHPIAIISGRNIALPTLATVLAEADS
jgi:threonine dehydratase